MLGIKIDMQDIGHIVAGKLCEVLDDIQDRADEVATAKAKAAYKDSFATFKTETGFLPSQAKIVACHCRFYTEETIAGHRVIFCNETGKYLQKGDACPSTNQDAFHILAKIGVG